MCGFGSECRMHSTRLRPHPSWPGSSNSCCPTRLCSRSPIDATLGPGQLWWQWTGCQRSSPGRPASSILGQEERISSSFVPRSDAVRPAEERRSPHVPDVVRERVNLGRLVRSTGVNLNVPPKCPSMSRATSRGGGKEGRLATDHPSPRPAAAPRASPDRNVLLYLRTGSAAPTQSPGPDRRPSVVRSRDDPISTTSARRR